MTFRVPPGTYDVSELDIPSGWKLTNLSCVNTGQNTSTTDLTTATATVHAFDDDSSTRHGTTCTFENSRVASILVEKTWVVNGVEYPHGQQPLGMTATLTLTGPGTAGATSQPFGTRRSGYLKGDSVTFDEGTTIPNRLCTLVSSRVTEANDTDVDLSLPQTVTLGGGLNSYEITNTVTCRTSLTLLKTVDDNGTGDSTPDTAWTLTASGPETVSGVEGDAPITGSDMAVGDYTLSESGPGTHTKGDWDCGDHPVTDTGDGTARITIGLADAVVCEIVNTAVPSSFEVLKESDPVDGAEVMPGDEITYTVTVTSHGEGVDSLDVEVFDDATDVLDDATLLAGPTVTTGTVVQNGTTFEWDIPILEAGGSAQLTYTVVVDEDEWDTTLRNVVTAPGSENCPAGCTDPDCDTIHTTPPVMDLDVLKVDLETDEVLAGAEFDLYADNAPIGTLDAGDELIGSATSGTDGLAHFTELLEGAYLVEETAPPPGYGLPEVTVQAVDLTGANFVGDGLVQITFRDPAQGKLAILGKKQFELVAGEWVESDGVIGFGEQVKYVVEVSATGIRNFHNVTLTDYVPGHNPVDTESVDNFGKTVRAKLVEGSATCAGFDCEVSVGENGLVTWEAGTLHQVTGTVEMVVVFPPQGEFETRADGSRFASSQLWNQAYLDFDVVVGKGASGVELEHTRMASNEVLIKAEAILPSEPIQPPPATPPGLPPTGAAPYLLPLAGLGGLALTAGMVVLHRGRRRLPSSSR